jgi:hypothetical protein
MEGARTAPTRAANVVPRATSSGDVWEQVRLSQVQSHHNLSHAVACSTNPY